MQDLKIFGVRLPVMDVTNEESMVLPTMREQHSGKIINISSFDGSFGEPHGYCYHTPKFAVEGLNDSLRM